MRRYGIAAPTSANPGAVGALALRVPPLPIVPEPAPEIDLEKLLQEAYDKGFNDGSAGGPALGFLVNWFWNDTGTEWELTVEVESLETLQPVGGVIVELPDIGDSEDTQTDGHAVFYMPYEDAGELEIYVHGIADTTEYTEDPTA